MALTRRVSEAVSSATTYAWNLLKPDAHWNGELLSNPTITAEQVFFHQSICGEKGQIPDADKYRKYLLGEQQADGSWGIAPGHPGDVSTSCEAYLALRILGVSRDAPELRKARRSILLRGGIAKVRVFTRFFLAQFGLLPWAATPQIPAEFILMPCWVSINIYRLSSWARSTIVPLLLIAHHQPVYPLPNGTNRDNKFLDELWINPSNKMLPLSPSWLTQLSTDSTAAAFGAVDSLLRWLNGLRNQPLRPYARRQCVKWILEHQEAAGDWAGIIPPMHAGVQALLLEGFTLQDKPIEKALAAIERFTWEDDKGKRLQSCVSPVWDTVLMIRGLCDAGVGEAHPSMKRVIRWIKERQIVGNQGDWRVYTAKLPPGGFSFEYYNTWYPDVDDTAAAVLALVRHSSSAVSSVAVSRAVEWLCGMQNSDGGWAAFDLNNDKLWLNKIPFSDMDALCDPSSADVTGRILEAFGLIIRIATTRDEYVDKLMIRKMSDAADRGIAYLCSVQEPCGAWYGRWGVNYIYGTSNVLCGLEYFSHDNGDVQEMMEAGADWLKLMQHDDGSWGEQLQSYGDVGKAGQGASTPSQTAWALLGLLTICPVGDKHVVGGIEYLLDTQTELQGDGGRSWAETLYTGTGFPNFFYIGYTLYRHYFPLMALGRFLSACEEYGQGAHLTNGVESDKD